MTTTTPRHPRAGRRRPSRSPSTPLTITLSAAASGRGSPSSTGHRSCAPLSGSSCACSLTVITVPHCSHSPRWSPSR
ncbi:hypothetical protein C1I98_28585 [Spongiactinospora gelatinilytica]|uniref:Uncharacterized protein n=1 Tax=Spongiactinospora gelatinilytica TaxID=2666298 RepID=A0A2W2G9R7_9ACTN|nr:hypothetical protein C1I98_28585 [Spongiactinospora gelatinilytica]